MKFKVGDKVRVIGKSEYCRFFYYQIHKIESVLRDEPYPYKLDGPSQHPVFYVDELEKVK